MTSADSCNVGFPETGMVEAVALAVAGAGVRARRNGDSGHGADRQRQPSDRGGEDGLEKAGAQAGGTGVGPVPVREEGEGGGAGTGQRGTGMLLAWRGRKISWLKDLLRKCRLAVLLSIGTGGGELRVSSLRIIRGAYFGGDPRRDLHLSEIAMF